MKQFAFSYRFGTAFYNKVASDKTALIANGVPRHRPSRRIQAKRYDNTEAMIQFIIK
jgi:hypothetical protein